MHKWVLQLKKYRANFAACPILFEVVI